VRLLALPQRVAYQSATVVSEVGATMARAARQPASVLYEAVHQLPAADQRVCDAFTPSASTHA
jgi:hypothetical protein